MNLPIFITFLNLLFPRRSNNNLSDSEKNPRQDNFEETTNIRRQRSRSLSRGRVHLKKKVTFHDEQVTPQSLGISRIVDGQGISTSIDTSGHALSEIVVPEESHSVADDDPSPIDSDEDRETGEDESRIDDSTSDATMISDIDSISEIRRPQKKRSTISFLLSKVKHFILQSDPDGHVEEHIVNHRITPIISGILIPFSILLEIPGLTQRWYIRTEANKTIETRKNPEILDIGLGFSMACAIIANIALLVRFFERRVKTATIISIIMLSIHDIINTVAVISFGVSHRSSDGFTFGQSFWFTVCSTVVSLITNFTIIWDYVRTPDFAASGSGLSRKQRSLIIVVMLLLCYVTFGAGINSALIHIPFIDGLYFTIVTAETVGFGDIIPHTTGARIFVIFHGTTSIILLGLAVTITRDTVIESFEVSYRKRVARLKEKRKARKKHRADLNARKKAIKNQLRMAGLPLYANHKGHNGHAHARVGGGRGQRHHIGMHLNVDALTQEQLDAALEEARREREHELGLDQEPHTALTRDDIMHLSNTSSDTSIYKYEEAMAEDQQKEFKFKLIFVWSLFITFWLIGAVIFMKTEGWSYGIALWFCFESFTTIGYGDYYPVTPAGRSIFIVWALLGVGTMTILISVLVEASSSKYNTIMSRQED